MRLWRRKERIQVERVWQFEATVHHAGVGASPAALPLGPPQVPAERTLPVNNYKGAG